MRQWAFAPFIVLVASASLRCAPVQRAEPPALPSPAAAAGTTSALPSSQVVKPVEGDGGPAASTAAYTGLGAQSISKEVLAEFAPKTLEPAVSRRIQAMLDVRAPGAGRIAPDGSKLFFSWNVTGTRQIWRLDGPQRFPVQLTGGEDTTSVSAISPDGKWLVYSRDRAGEENPGIYLGRPEGGPLEVVQHTPGVQTMLELVADDSKSLVYRSNDKKRDSFALYRYDIASRKRELLFDQEGLWNVADWSASGKLLLAKNIGSNMAEYFELDVRTKTLTPLFGQGEREDYEAMYGAEPGEVLVQTPRFSEFRRLYRFSAAGQAPKGATPLAADKRFSPLTPDMPHDVESFTIDRARLRIYYQVNDNGFTRLSVLDARAFAEQKPPGLPRGDHVRIADVSRDGRFATVSVETAKSPARAYVIDWKSGKTAAWHTPSAPEIDTSMFAEAKFETYPARDGTPVPMFVRRPAACERAQQQAPCPVVVSFHGGPEGQSRPGFSTYAQIFVDAGFIFVEPNVRGSEGYGKKWLHADDGPKRLDAVLDIEDCARFLRKSWAVAGHEPRIGVFGGSYGGYSSLLAMTRFAGDYDAGVSIVGISNLLTFLRNTAPYRRILRISEYGDPDKDEAALRELSPITHVDKVKGPLLLLQGATDPRVPVGEAIQIHRALSARGVPAELMIFPDEGHGAQKRSNQVLMIGHAVRFFEERLGVKGS